MIKKRLHFSGEPWQETYNGEVYNEVSSPRPWVSWWEEGGNPFPWDPNNTQGYRRPETKRIPKAPPYLDPPRVLPEEDFAFQSFTFYGVHHSGLYQQIEVPAGATVKATGYAHAWYSGADNPHESSGGPGDFTQMVGIDPTGGTDPFSPSVVWSAPVSNYDTYKETSAAEAVAVDTTVTIFTREWCKWRLKHADGQWGAVDLEISAPTPPPVPPDGTLSLEAVIALLEAHWPTTEPPVTPGDTVAGMTPYSMRDPEWAADIMVTRPLGKAGCAVTASAIISSLVDKTVTPGVLNTRLKLVDGYTPVGHPQGPDLLYWAKVAEVVPGVHFVEYAKWTNTPADVAAVKTALAANGQVILGVDYDHTGDYDSHFVVGYALTEDGQDIKIIDPWSGDTTTLLTRYGAPGWDLARAIYAMAVFSFQATNTNPNKVGLHVQNWTQGVADFVTAVKPAVVKVFDVSDITKVWACNPDALVVYRHWVDGDGTYLDGDISAKVNHFVDKFAGALVALSDIPQVQQGLLAVESINEVMAGSNIVRAVQFDREFIRVLRQKCPLVRPVVATIPVGNPQPNEIPAILPLAQDIVAANGFMGYHNYWGARDGVSFLEDEWKWYAGRFEMMQDYFVANGVAPNWVFGETGAIKIETTGYMPPNAGWVECLGELTKYAADVATYKRLLNESRYAANVVGGCLFTVNTMGGWPNFRHDDAVLAKLTEVLSA